MSKLKPYHKKGPGREKMNRSQEQEKECAERIGGTLVKGSGCGAEKGDVRKPGFVRVECKSTVHESFRITREVVEKIEREALGAGEVPVLEVEFAGEPKLKVLVIPAYALKLIVDLI